MIKRFFNGWASTPRVPELPDVIIHIGAPKSGSSAIQRFCVSRRDELLSLGFYYPKHSLDVNGVSGGHSQVAGSLIRGDNDLAKETFHRWLSKAKAKQACLLLSSEAFYGQHEAMSEFCQGLNVKVVGFLRHPVDYLLANHNQGIKRHMSTIRLGKLLSQSFNRSTGHLVGLPLINWADAFGDINCCFKPYRSPSLNGGYIEGHFLTALGVPKSEIDVLLNHHEGFTNRSYVKSALELKRLINTVLADLSVNTAHQVDWSLQGYSDRARDEQSFSMLDLSPEVLDHIQTHLLKQMSPVVSRFPELDSVATLPSVSRRSSSLGWLDLSSPFAALMEDAPHVVDEIKKRAIVLRDQGRQDYVFCKLLDVLGVEFNEPSGSAHLGLSSPQRRLLAKKSTSSADYLREIAVLLERQGMLEDALFTINQALAVRPNGVGIQRIKARIEKVLSLQEALNTSSTNVVPSDNLLSSKKPEADQQ